MSVRESELAILARLASLREHHADEQDVFHMAETLGTLARGSLARLGEEAEPPPPAPAGDLLADLRDLHLRYCAASIDYVIAAQGAQAQRDRDRVAALSASHAQALRGLKWTTTRIKESAPQLLGG